MTLTRRYWFTPCIAPSNILYLTVKDANKCCSTVLLAEFEKELFVAFDDHNKPIVCKPECL